VLRPGLAGGWASKRVGTVQGIITNEQEHLLYYFGQNHDCRHVSHSSH
jgi:hypothetical protein